MTYRSPKLLTCLAAIVAIAGTTLAQESKPAPVPAPAAAPTPAPAPAPAPITDKLVYVRIVTNFGDILVELNNEKAPITVANFIKYVDRGFYSNTLFHRTIPGFMIQGGGFDLDQNQKETEAPIKNESTNGLPNARGTIAMARLSTPDSANCQFFINVKDNDGLNAQPETPAAGTTPSHPPQPGYCVFGKVVAGMDVVDAIKEAPACRGRISEAVPLEQIVIEKIERIPSAGVEAATAATNATAEKAKAELKRRVDAIGGDAQLVKALEFLKTKDVDVTKGTKTASGVWWIETQAGKGDDHPGPTERVTVNYSGWLVDGKPFDSSVTRGKPASFALNGVVKGWSEGLQMMSPGSKRFFVIPPEMAWGANGRAPMIPCYSSVVFEVELVSIDRPIPPEKQFSMAMDLVKGKGIDIANGKKLDSGVWFADITPGTGESPKMPDNITVHYTGWTVDGKEFDSSVRRGSPYTLPLQQFIKGWHDGVGTMKVGGKRMLVIPADLAYGDAGGAGGAIPPKSILVMEVELLSIQK